MLWKLYGSTPKLSQYFLLVSHVCAGAGSGELCTVTGALKIAEVPSPGLSGEHCGVIAAVMVLIQLLSMVACFAYFHGTKSNDNVRHV